MLVNESKTELMIIHRSEKVTKSILIGDSMIKSVDKIKVLVIIFNQNLSWFDHVRCTINNCQKILHGLRVVRKFYNEKEFNNITTCFLFSKLFYGIEIWSYDLLSYECKKVLDSFYYKICRTIINDHFGVISRQIIDQKIKRATPREFSDYCIARTIILNFNCNNSPVKHICLNNSYSITRKNGQLFFFDSSRLRIEKNSISNRADLIFKKLNFPWLNITPETLRPKLKRALFKYAS